MRRYILLFLWLLSASTLRAVAGDAECLHSQLASGRWSKIRVQRTGVVKLSVDELRRMGFQAPERVRVFGYGGYLLPQHFARHTATDLPEVPTQRIGDGVLFYARGSVAWIPSIDLTSLVRERNYYSDEGYYFLTDSEEIPPTLFTPIQAPEQPDADLHLSTFDACVLHEEDAYSWGSSGRNL
ncbi:MAG: hypothetical protein LBL97_01150, partial [Prevotellaceae bacterium]|nr:hypothetical protein [Prevotellaceae bacterium]